MRISLFLFLVMAGISCSQSGAEVQSELSVDAFETMLSKDTPVQLIDVRTPQEYASGHVEGAKLINYYGDGFIQQIEKLDKNTPVMVYCAAGSRSASAATQFKKAGFKKVYDMTGGMNAWRASGKKTVQ